MSHTAAQTENQTVDEIEALLAGRLHPGDLVDSADRMVLLTDADGVVCFASGGGPDLVGRSAETLVGRALTELVEPGDRDRVYNLAGQVRADHSHRPVRVGFGALVDQRRPQLLEADVARLDRPGTPTVLVWVVRDLRRRQFLQPASEGSLRDDLTGLASREMLLTSLDLALARGRRTDTRLAVLLVDVAAFSPTWDAIGHGPAEELLLTAADRLESVARLGDLVARVDADELVIVLDDVTQDEVDAAVREVMTLMAQPVQAGQQPVPLDVSAGVAHSSDQASAESLLEQAVAAADHARHEPTVGSAVFHSSMAPPERRSRDLTADLQDAIREGKVRAVYQPIVDLKSGRLSGFEALARWDHPERGPIPPAMFVTLAEQTGLIAELGRHMLVTACQQMEIWRQACPHNPLRIGVNASPKQLVGRTLLDDIRRALKFSGLPAEHLVVEITESGLHRDLTGVRHLLGELRDLGVHTAMDDFGTGYSSLAYLRRLPLDILKIDKSFIGDSDGDGATFLTAIVTMGAQLGLDILAEGIELPEQFHAAAKAGCAFGQGYLMSRPLEADAAGHLVASSEPLWTVPSEPAVKVSAI